MKKDPTPEEAAEELLFRGRARLQGSEYRHYVSGLLPAKHSRLLWSKLHDVMDRKINRLMVFMPPGAAKTTDVSHHFPAFYLSKFTDHGIIAATHTDKFAEQNGRRVRNIIMGDEHRTLFPSIGISEDSSAAARWETTKRGMYSGFGVGATVVGRRAHGLILDDVVAGMAAADSQTDRDFIWNWFGGDLATRVIPGGFIILVMTRYHPDDIAGRLLAGSQMAHGDKWEVLSLPALAKDNDPLGRKPGEALWPEWQDAKELTRIKNQSHMTSRMWEALYQQSPVIESGNLVQRSWFKIWRGNEPPACKYILQSWDTALTNQKGSSWSACTTWGIFDEPESGMPAMILLSFWRGKLLYPDLRKMATRLSFNYMDDHYDMPKRNPAKLAPDTILIENKSSGATLIQDLNRAGIFVTGYNPNKDGDKETRLHLTLDFFENGRIWVPGAPPNYTQPRRWAEEYINICVQHPASDSRDTVDSTTQAILKIKRGGWVQNTADPRPPEYGWSSERRHGSIY